MAAEKVEKSERQSVAQPSTDSSRALSNEVHSNPATASSDIKAQRTAVSNDSEKLAQNQMLGNVTLTGTDEKSQNKPAAANRGIADNASNSSEKAKSDSASSFADRYSAADPAASFNDRFSAAQPVSGFNDRFSLTDNASAPGNNAATQQAGKPDKGNETAPQSKDARAQELAGNMGISGEPLISDKTKYAQEMIDSAGKIASASPQDRASVFNNEADKFHGNHPDLQPSSFSNPVGLALQQEPGGKNLSVSADGPHVDLYDSTLKGPGNKQGLVADKFVGSGKGYEDTDPTRRLADGTSDKVIQVLNNDKLSDTEMRSQLNTVLKKDSKTDLAIDPSGKGTQEKLSQFNSALGAELARKGVEIPSAPNQNSISTMTKGNESYLHVQENFDLTDLRPKK